MPQRGIGNRQFVDDLGRFPFNFKIRTGIRNGHKVVRSGPMSGAGNDGATWTDIESLCASDGTTWADIEAVCANYGISWGLIA